ncbi:hypothetical protein K2173_008632 [Erythroxylum novogranatense]|uniref:non-specific serine/threonine protein kinase n=1 Tax=Erythroxylum novogranatense TaxID=1862640 RepID=A0AAV8SKW7_9ROSI|nr:hypothetical protein K2173_008632 [Erythroxylum novogranatense]
MSRFRLICPGVPTFVFVVLCLRTCISQQNHRCPPSSCGNLHNISYPFRLQSDPSHSGFPFYELSCVKNVTVLYLYNGVYFLQSINYNNFTLRVTDAGVQNNDCSSVPAYSFSGSIFTFRDPYGFQTNSWFESEDPSRVMLFVKCGRMVDSSLYVSTSPCIEYNMFMYSLPFKDNRNVTYMEVHNGLVYGFKIAWYKVVCEPCLGEEYCYLYGSRGGKTCSKGDALQRNLILMLIGIITRVKIVLHSPCVFMFLFYTWRRRHLSMYDTVEAFLQSQNNLMPIRYSYSEIRKMTNGFKDKLEEGGYGLVYKAKLRSGHLAAVKMLGKSNANGQEFINEVATIGRIHHVNVVRPVGYCVEGLKRAVVYDFMPKGSLDKYIFSREGFTPLNWEKLFEISVGIARGIEYLHKGCNMQILHFDIKPHNILLDENFTPKVSDFGLARLYPTNNSFVSFTAIRGTIGYMAPELFYRNIGGVSYKADVYKTNHSSQYFPDWVHREATMGKFEVEDVSECEMKLVKKMVIVALWCIQMNPANRPPMNKVMEMLEADVECLELPPKPVLYPKTIASIDTGDCTDDTSSSSCQIDYSETSSLIANSYQNSYM